MIASNRPEYTNENLIQQSTIRFIIGSTLLVFRTI